MEIRDARVLITGGTRGLGRQFALDLAEAGARVGVCAKGRQGVEDFRAEAEARGVAVWGAPADVSDEGDVERLFDAFVEDHGGLDAAVLNAGITRDGLLARFRDGEVQTLSRERWDEVIATNLTGVFLCGRAAARHMMARGTRGVIVPISSVCRDGNRGQTNYAAAKAGVVAMTSVWAKELVRHGIRAVALSPGYVATEMTGALREDVRQKVEASIPLGRMGSVDEVSHALRFVLENEYVNGKVVEVDGGLRV